MAKIAVNKKILTGKEFECCEIETRIELDQKENKHRITIVYKFKYSDINSYIDLYFSPQKDELWYYEKVTHECEGPINFIFKPNSSKIDYALKNILKQHQDKINSFIRTNTNISIIVIKIILTSPQIMKWTLSFLDKKLENKKSTLNLSDTLYL